jgi:hypothetical protein
LPAPVAAVNGWCRKNRHWSLRDQHRHLSSMMRGHFAYYGVGGNSRACAGLPIKWCESGASGCLGVIVKARSDGPASTNSWHGIHCLQSRSAMATPPRAKLSREEPDAENLHVRVCEGSGRQRPHLLGSSARPIRLGPPYQRHWVVVAAVGKDAAGDEAIEVLNPLAERAEPLVVTKAGFCANRGVKPCFSNGAAFPTTRRGLRLPLVHPRVAPAEVAFRRSGRCCADALRARRGGTNLFFSW